MKELIKDAVFEDLDNKIQYNLSVLLDRVNLIREAYNKPMTVTSGLRTLEHHLAIYAAKGITDKTKIPMKSLHLVGLACDLVPIEDDIKHLHDWVRNNEKILEDIGLFYESLSVTLSWLHLQSVPFSSYKKGGKIWFIP